MEQPARKRCRVVVLGGSFAGLTLIRELRRALPDGAQADVTLVEPKAYAEYTPGCLRALVDPSYLEHLTVPLRSAVPQGTHVLQGRAASVVQDASGAGGTVHVQLTHAGAAAALVPVAYDLLVIATGTSYPEPCKAAPEHTTPGSREDNVNSTYSALALARHVIIVGGGAVGVELAGELVGHWLHAGSPPALPGASAAARGPRTLSIIQATPTMLTGLPASLCAASEAWLRSHGVRMYVNDILTSQIPPSAPGAGDGHVTTRSGHTLPADVIFTCLGIKPHTAFLTDQSGAAQAPPSSPAFASALRPTDKRVIVDAAFRVPGVPGVFALGDVAAHPCIEPGLAHTAEKQALVLSHSLARLITRGWAGPQAPLSPLPLGWRLVAWAARRGRGAEARGPAAPVWNAASPWEADTAAAAYDAPGVALCYPGALTGRSDAPIITVISLGWDRALLSFNGTLCLTDPWVGQRLAAAAKLLVERSKVAELRLALLGVLFWRVAELLSALAHVLVLAPGKSA